MRRTRLGRPPFVVAGLFGATSREPGSSGRTTVGRRGCTEPLLNNLDQGLANFRIRQDIDQVLAAQTLLQRPHGFHCSRPHILLRITEEIREVPTHAAHVDRSKLLDHVDEAECHGLPDPPLRAPQRREYAFFKDLDVADQVHHHNH